MNPEAVNGPIELSDRELVLAFQQGSDEAYDEMYRRHAPRVRRVCGKILINSQDVEEATQETFLKAYQALGRFNGRYQLGAWLSRIAANVCLDHMRSRNRSASTVALDQDHDLAASERGPEDVVVGDDPRVDLAIGNLQPLHAQALKLRALDGLSHQEIAGQLAMTPAQVKALLHRARTSFRRAWDRAEGFALAPIVGLRALLGHRSDAASGAGTNLLGAAPSFTPLLAERVATSAVIVVVALTGGVSAPPQQAAPDRLHAAAPERGTMRVKQHGVAGGTARWASGTARRTPASQPAGPKATAAPGVAQQVLRAVGHAKAKLPNKPKDPRDDEGGNSGWGGVGPAETRPVLKKVKETLSGIAPAD